MKNRTKALAAGLLALGLAVAPSIPASAATFTVYAEDAAYNETRHYGSPRWHSSGSMYYKLTSYSYSFCGGTFQYAMRAEGGAMTGWGTFNSSTIGTTRNLSWAHNTSGIPPAGNYYVSTSNFGAGCDYHTIDWSGTLTM